MRQSKLRFIGITGGIGAGKSEILNYIRRHYVCEIYLADEVAHEVKKTGSECYQRLVELLGQDILDKDAGIDKKKMADRIFVSSELLEQVNGIIHPAVRQYLLERLEIARQRNQVELFFVEAALLIECGYGELVDEMWYVYADEEVRRQRLRNSRGYSNEKVDHILLTQLTDEQFRNQSDFIIDNSGSLEESCRQIDRKLEGFTWRR